MVADFTIDDLNVLIEAMEAWEHKDGEGQLMGKLLTSMLRPKDGTPEQLASWEAKENEDSAKYDRQRGERKERSVLLRAKLIQMLDVARAGVLTSDMGNRA